MIYAIVSRRPTCTVALARFAYAPFGDQRDDTAWTAADAPASAAFLLGAVRGMSSTAVAA